MCGAPDQDTLPPLEVSAKEAVVHGTVVKAGSPLPGAYVRLLDGTGDRGAVVPDRALDHRLRAEVDPREGAALLRCSAHGSAHFSIGTPTSEPYSTQLPS